MNTSECFLDKRMPESHDRLTTNRHQLVIFGLVTSLVTAFTITTNVVLFTVLIFSRHHGTNKRGNNVRITSSNISNNSSMIMTSLVVCNIVLGTISMPMAVHELINNGFWTLGPLACIIRKVSDVVVGCVSIYHVICMATDMYIAVCWPFKYRLLPAMIGYYMIGACWVTPCALILTPMMLGKHREDSYIDCPHVDQACVNVFNKPFFIFCMTISLFIPFSAISTMYGLIVRSIVQYHKRTPNNFILVKRIENKRHWIRCPSSGIPLQEEDRHKRCIEIFSVDEMKSVPKQKDFRDYNSPTTSDFDSNNRAIESSTNKEFQFEVFEDDDKINKGSAEDGMTQICQNNDILNLNGVVTNDSTAYVICVGVSPSKKSNVVVSSDCKPSILYDSSEEKSTSTQFSFRSSPAADTRKSNNLSPRSIVTDGKSLVISAQTTFSNRTQKNRSGSPTTRQSVKAFRMIGCIMACFSLCWFPFCIFLIVFMYDPTAMPMWSMQVISWLGYMSSSITPIVLVGNNNVRVAFKSLVNTVLKSSSI